MKKISTLGFGVLISLASFAQNGSDHFKSAGHANFKITIGVNRFDRAPFVAEARINESPVRGAYNDGSGWGNGKNRDDHAYKNNNSDHGYNNDRDRHNNDYVGNLGYNNSRNYGRAISNEDFFAAERVMDRENDNGRLLYAKRLVDENYLSAEQVKELARFFSFDNCRFDFVRYAYSKTNDRDNYSVVCNSFSSNDGRNQVMSFIKSCR
jgi:Domain of unknown function (DUF4476)